MSDQLFLVPITIKTLKRRGIVFNRRDIKRGCFLGDNYERDYQVRLQETRPYLFEEKKRMRSFRLTEWRSIGLVQIRSTTTLAVVGFRLCTLRIGISLGSSTLTAPNKLCSNHT